MFSFKNVETPSESKSLDYGVHEVSLATTYVTGENKQTGEPFEAMEVTFTDAEGATNRKRYFLASDDERNGKTLKRLLHLFSAVVEEEVLRGLSFTTFKQMAEHFASYNGRKLRVLLAPKQNDPQYAGIPDYYSGWAEALSVNPTRLRLNAQQESEKQRGLAIRASAPQKGAQGASAGTPMSPAASEAHDDTLPF